MKHPFSDHIRQYLRTGVWISRREYTRKMLYGLMALGVKYR
jgi:hypothetical protein